MPGQGNSDNEDFMTIRETLSEGKKLLKSPSPSSVVENPDLDAVLLLAETLHISREELVIRTDEPIAEHDRKEFLSLLERRRGGECVAYILGRKEFRNLEFFVKPGVLVPRPDTETLVEAALEYIDSRQETKASVPVDKDLSLLDLCTGSGALAISLKNERPFLSVIASDISAEALETAACNAARLLNSPAEFVQSDLFSNIPENFDIIVSNPPYIPSAEIDTLAPELRLEGRLALDGGEDGLDLIRKIITQVPEHLFSGGILLLEAGPEQMLVIKTLLVKSHFCAIKIHNDLSGRQRVISGRIL